MGLVGRSMLVLCYPAAEQGHRRQQLPPPSKSRSRSMGPTALPTAASPPTVLVGPIPAPLGA